MDKNENMVFRLLYMKDDMMKLLGVKRRQLFTVLEVCIKTQGRKYPREIKWVYRKTDDCKKIGFLWYEGRIYY